MMNDYRSPHSTGDKVYVGDDDTVQGVVIAVMFEGHANGLHDVRVQWWNGRSLEDKWMKSCAVRAVAAGSPHPMDDRIEKGWTLGLRAAARYLRTEAAGKELSSRGALGGMFANQSSTDLRAAADAIECLKPDDAGN